MFQNINDLYNKGRDLAKNKLTQMVKSSGDVANYFGSKDDTLVEYGAPPVTSLTENSILHAQEGIPETEEWPNRPLYIRQTRQSRSHAADSPMENVIEIHKNGPPEVSEFPINSAHFRGKAYLIVAGIDGAPDEYFSGKKRSFQFVVQGKFVEALSFSRVYTGQAFEWDLPVPPPAWLVKTLKPILTFLQPGVKISTTGSNPHVLSPLMSTMHHIIATPENETPPSISSHLEKLTDDLKFHGELFEHMKPAQRKHYFSKLEHLELYSFDPTVTYTFDFYEHLLNMSTLMLDLGMVNYDILQVLGPRFVQLMSVVWTPPVRSTATSRNVSKNNSNAPSVSASGVNTPIPRRPSSSSDLSTENTLKTTSSDSAAATTGANVDSHHPLQSSTLNSRAVECLNEGTNEATHNTSNQLSAQELHHHSEGNNKWNNDVDHNNDNNFDNDCDSMWNDVLSEESGRKENEEDTQGGWDYLYSVEVWHERSLYKPNNEITSRLSSSAI